MNDENDENDENTSIGPALLELLQGVARDHGLLQLGIASLDDPRFGPARTMLAEHLDRGLHGEMKFMSRTREVRGHPEQMLPEAKSVLVAAVPYRGRQGPVARYAQSADYHSEVHRRLGPVIEALSRELPQVASLACVDTKPLLERSAAVIAGLGFIGKHGCVISPGLGSYVLLGSVLTTARWTGPEPLTHTGDRSLLWDACGSCTRCLDACPTRAFEAPGRLDPRRCISYLTIEHRGAIDEELADSMGERIAGCDVCQEVCPYNQSESRESRVPDPAWLPPPPRDPDWSPAAAIDLPMLLRLARLGSGRHRAFVKDTALNRIPRRALRRNALLALGNRTAPLDAAAIEVLETMAAEEPDPELRRLATRALEKSSPNA